MPLKARHQASRWACLFFALAVLLQPCTSLSDYIDPKGANFSLKSVDLHFSRVDRNLRLERSYQSRIQFDGLFGPGWCSTLEDILEPVPKDANPSGESGWVRYVACGAGEPILFKPERNGIFRAPGYGTLEKKDSTFVLNLTTRSPVVSMGAGCPACPLELLVPTGTAVFDSEGRLLQRSLDGSIWTFSYAQGLLRSLRDDDGQEINLLYYSNGKVREARGSNGGRSRYRYDFKGQLIWAELPDGKVWTYEYDQFKNMTRVNFPGGAAEDIRYRQDLDQAIGIRFPNNRVVNYDYRDAVRGEADHLWADITKIEGSKMERSRFETWYRNILSLDRSIETSGEIVRDIEWDSRGLPRSITSNGLRRSFRAGKGGGVVGEDTVQNISTPAVRVKEVTPSENHENQ